MALEASASPVRKRAATRYAFTPVGQAEASTAIFAQIGGIGMTYQARRSTSPGMTISFKEKTHKLLRENQETLSGHQVPSWLDFNPAQLEAKIVAVPTPELIPFEMNANLIIEFYR